MGADAEATERGTVRIQNEAERRWRLEEFRLEAAEELDTNPENVEITQDGDQLRAETDLSNEQQFFDELAGGRLSGVVDTAEGAREQAADVFTSVGSTYGTASAIPASLVGGAVGSGFDSVGIDGNGAVSDAFGDAASTAGQGRQQAQQAVDDLGERVDLDGVRDAFDDAAEVVPDPGPRESARAVSDTSSSLTDRFTAGVVAGAPSQPLLGPEGAQNTGQTPRQMSADQNDDACGASGDFTAEDALALGAAGIVTPEPVTSVGGGVLVGGAALALGASAVANRGEIDTPESGDFIGAGGTTGELEAGDDATQTLTREIDTGEAGVTEIEPGQFVPDSEVGTPTDADSSELLVPEATQLVQQQQQVIEEDPRQINPGDIDDPFGEIEQDPPSTRERQRRDDLDVFERDFPTGGSAVIGQGNAQNTVDAVEEAQQPTLEQTAESTGLGSGSGGDIFGGVGVGAGPAADVFSDLGARTDVAQTQQPASGLVSGVQSAQLPGQFAEPAANPLAQETANQFAQPTGGTASSTARQFDLSLPGLEADDPAPTRPRRRDERDDIIFEFADPLGGFDSDGPDVDDSLFGGL
jgi:hypothetical protein